LKRATEANARKNAPKNGKWVKGIGRSPLGPAKENIITSARRNNDISKNLRRYSRQEKELKAAQEARKKGD
jgi:hypothetical protein